MRHFGPLVSEQQQEAVWARNWDSEILRANGQQDICLEPVQTGLGASQGECKGLAEEGASSEQTRYPLDSLSPLSTIWWSEANLGILLHLHTKLLPLGMSGEGSGRECSLPTLF